jgi:hypothetical protein
VLRCSGGNRGTRWVDDGDLWFASLPPQHGARVLFSGSAPRRNRPFCENRQDRIAKQTGSATSRSKISTMQKAPNCRLQQKTSQSGDPEDGPIPPPSFIVVGCPRRFARGAVGSNCPHGTPKAGKKKLLTLWLVGKGDRKKSAELSCADKRQPLI